MRDRSVPSTADSTLPRDPRLYLMVLRTPRVRVPAIGTALASVPIGMLGLGLLLLVQQRTGSFGAAGAVVAVLGVGTVLGMVVQGGLLDRFGPRPVLLASSTLRAVASVALVVVAGLRPPLWLVAMLTFVVGASEPQVGSTLRALWPSLVGRELRPAAAALSSLLFELPVLAGPLLLAVVIAVLPVEVAVVGAAAFAFAGSWMVAWSTAARQWRKRSAPPARGVLGSLGTPAVRVIVLVTAVQGLATGLVQVTSAASVTTAGAADRAGLVYAVLTAGSLLGTTLYGARSRPVASRWHVPALLTGLAGTMALAAAVPSVLVLAASAFVFGLFVGPLTVRCFLDLERHAPPGSPAASVTVLIAAGLAATSVGSAVAGWMIDAGGTTLSLIIGSGCSVSTALLLLRESAEPR